MAIAGSDDFLRAEQAAQFILERTSLRPRIGVVLGSGLGAIAAGLTDTVRISYEEIPHFPKARLRVMRAYSPLERSTTFPWP